MNQIKKYSITLIVTAAIIVEVIGAVQYFMARYSSKQEMLSKAQRDMQESKRVAMVKTEVETAINNAEQSVRVALTSPETSYCIASRIITINPHIAGVGVAFVPNYYKDKGINGLYMPYTYDDQPSIASKGKRTGKTHLQTRVPPLDYTQRDWFKSAIAGQRQWTNVYLGEGGLNVLMCTYSIPVKDKNGKLACVLFADVTMEDATVLLNNINSGISRSGLVTLVIQLFSILLMGFIIWRAVGASRRYKEQVVDPEKEHLAEQLAKLREVNNRLIKRNQMLAEKNVQLESMLKTRTHQENDSQWFG